MSDGTKALADNKSWPKWIVRWIWKKLPHDIPCLYMRYGYQTNKWQQSSNQWLLMLDGHYRSHTICHSCHRARITFRNLPWDVASRPSLVLFALAQCVYQISRVWRRDFAQSPLTIPWWYRRTNKQPQRHHKSTFENARHDTFPSSMTQWMQDGPFWSEEY